MEETLFRQELQKRTAAIEELLKEYLPAEEGYQKTVIEATNYSLMAGGKRLRPMLMQDPDSLGAYFASPVTMETIAMYPVATYGSANLLQSLPSRLG